MNTLRNKVSLIGRIGKNPEMQTVGIGKDYSLTRFSIATDESYRDKSGQWHDNTQWHNVIAWGKTAELIAKMVKKGHEVMIEGKIVNKMYEKDGEKRYTTDIEATDFLLLSPKNNQKTENTPVENNAKSSK